MASQEQFNELQQLLQQQQKQVEELQARLNAQNDAGQGLQNQLAEEQRQRVLATDELGGGRRKRLSGSSTSWLAGDQAKLCGPGLGSGCGEAAATG